MKLPPNKIRKNVPELATLSDTELEEIQIALYELGQLAFEVWLHKKSGSKNPAGLFPFTTTKE